MIEPNTYSANFYKANGPIGLGHPPVHKGKNIEEDAAAAMDFARILKEDPVSGKAAPASNAANSAGPAAEEPSILGFIKGVIDIINPLQHIPVISAIYRHMTGDEINPAAQLAGNILYGGPIGGALALADIAYEKTTGKDFGETKIAGLTDDKNKATEIAQNLPPAPTLLPHREAITEEPAPSSYTPTTAAAYVLHPQTAPAATSRMDDPPEPVLVPKEMIAAKMMEALDKYREMKQSPAEPQISGLY